MKTNKECISDSCLCEKGRAFTHIPTKFLLIFEIDSLKNHTGKEGEQVLLFKKIQYKRFLEVSPKKLLIVGQDF